MKRFVNFYSLVVLGFTAYLLLRAWKVDVTYDEAWTLMDFVPTGVSDVLNCIPCDANNHILNTLLIKVSYFITEDHLFWARLPNVLAGVLYLFATIRISQRFLQGLGSYVFVVLMLANPFLLEFFALARGYGLALGFMTASVYFFLSYSQSLRWSTGLAGLLLASLAVMANFALLNYWLAACFVLIFWAFSKPFSWRIHVPVWLGVASLSLMLYLVLQTPVSKLIAQDGLYYGGQEGFYSDTLGSLVADSIYNPRAGALSDWILGILSTVIGAALILGVLSMRKQPKWWFSKAVLISCLLIISWASIVVQHHLFDTLYLISRTALFFYPLFILLFVFWLVEIDLRPWKNLMQWAAVLMAGVFLLNLLRHMNLSKTVTWEFDAHNREILQAMESQARGEGKEFEIGGVHLFIRGMLYQINDFPNLTYRPEQSLETEVESDYYLYYSKDLPRIGYDASEQRILSFRSDTILQYPEEGVYLLGNFSH